MTRTKLLIGFVLLLVVLGTAAGVGVVRAAIHHSELIADAATQSADEARLIAEDAVDAAEEAQEAAERAQEAADQAQADADGLRDQLSGLDSGISPELGKAANDAIQACLPAGPIGSRGFDECVSNL